MFDTQYKSLKVLKHHINYLYIWRKCGSGNNTEPSQPKRVFDVYDIVANILGSLLGLGISVGYVTWVKQGQT